MIAALRPTRTKSRRTTRSPVLIGLFVLATFYTLYFARDFFLPVTMAVLLSFLFNPVVRWLHRWHIPRVLAAGAIPVGLLIMAAYGTSLLSQPAGEWLEKAPMALHQLENRLRHLLPPTTKINQAAAQVQQMTDGQPDGTPTVQVKRPVWTETLLGWVKGFIGSAVVTLVLLYFLLAAGDSLVLKLGDLLHRHEVVEITRNAERTISSYLFAITLINIGLGVLVGLAMFLVGLPNPLLWGVMVAMLNFVPYFGPLIGSAALLLAALMHSESWGAVVLPPGIYLGLHAVESNLITPVILGNKLTLQPVVIFFSLAFWGWLWGVAGALMAVPLLMTFKIVCDHIPSLSRVGEFLQSKTAPTSD